MAACGCPEEEDHVRKRALGLAVAMLVGVALVSASGAATAKAQKVTKIDVSTRAAVVHYLRSIHVNPRGAVIQRGHRNYAGARCPGKRWTCASTRHTVVQIAKPGGQNRFVCRSNHCVVVQVSGAAHGVYLSVRQGAAAPSKPGGGGGNSAVCVKTGSGATTGTGQSCTISQTSGAGSNTAGVYENTQKVSGLTQAAQYTALITQQSSGSNGNQACVTQVINLDGSISNMNGKPTTVTLKAHQSVIINQDAVGSGTNTANQAADSTGHCLTGAAPGLGISGLTPALTQVQTLTSSVNATGAITQNEDRNDTGLVDSTTIPCAPNQKPVADLNDSANLCMDVEQNQGAGKGHSSGQNAAVFWQENYLSAVAHTTAGPTHSINQTQGAAADGVGGLLVTVNQDSSGPSNFVSTQHETQCEDALPTTVSIPNTTPCSTAADGFPSGVTVTQNQYGPEGVGNAGTAGTAKHNTIHAYRTGKDPTTSSQTRGGIGDTYTINQTSKQNNDTGAIQNNHILGGLSTPGSGTITQNANIQGDNKQDVQTGGGVNFQSFINCDGTDPTHPKVSCSKTLSKPKITGRTPASPVFGTDATTFTFTNSDPTAAFSCSLDGVNYTPCNGVGSQTYSASSLPSGSHTFYVKTRDADNGALSGAADSATWVITPPDPSILTHPLAAATYGTDAVFTFSDADPTATFKCKLSGESSYTSCSSGKTYSGLASGAYTFSVKAYDSTGTYVSNNDDHFSWVVTPPDPVIDTGPSNGSSTDVTFTFSDSDPTVSFVCSLDGDAFTPCSPGPGTGSGSQDYTGLSSSSHTFSVEATDGSGNFSQPVSSTWTVGT